MKQTRAAGMAARSGETAAEAAAPTGNPSLRPVD